MVIYISRSGERLNKKDPGVAKFGIALEWGSRGPEFESQHSDQKETHDLWSCLSFWVPAAKGGVHPLI